MRHGVQEFVLALVEGLELVVGCPQLVGEALELARLLLELAVGLQQLLAFPENAHYTLVADFFGPRHRGHQHARRGRPQATGQQLFSVVQQARVGRGQRVNGWLGGWLHGRAWEVVFRHCVGETVGESAQGLIGTLFPEEAKQQGAHVGEWGAARPAGYFLGQTTAREHVHEHIGLPQLQGRRWPGQRQAHVQADVEQPAPKQAMRKVIEPFEPE